MEELYKEFLDAHPRLKKLLSKFPDSVYDERPCTFLISYEPCTALDFAEELEKGLDDLGRSFLLPDEVNGLSDRDLIRGNSKNMREEWTKRLALQYKYDKFPREYEIKKFQKEADTAIEQSKIVIPIITIGLILGPMKTYDPIKIYGSLKNNDKEIITAVHESVKKKKFEKELSRYNDVLKRNAVYFSTKEDLVDGVKSKASQFLQ